MSLKVNTYFFFILVYFFFNSVLLPEGLLYTNLFTPVFLYWIWKQEGVNTTLKYFLYSAPLIIIYLVLGVQFFSFIKSYLLLFSTFVFVYAFHLLLKTKQDLGQYYRPLLILNFLFTLLSVAAYYTPLNKVLWNLKSLTLNIHGIPRLQMLTYEPSYYSTLLAPIVIFYLLKVILKKEDIKAIGGYLVLCMVPLLFSFSLGVMVTIALSTLMMVFYYRSYLFKQRRLFNVLAFIVLFGMITLLFLVLFFPENPLFARINDIFTGDDISAQGRTVDALKMAALVAKTKSLLFGVGFGQIKIMGDEVVRNYYHYNATDIPIIRIPSAIGETLGTFGIFGLIFRLGIEIYLFFKTKVATNIYRFTIFIYIFIYQFGGSYLTNVAEYVLWVIAFTPAFQQFQLANFIKKHSRIIGFKD